MVLAPLNFPHRIAFHILILFIIAGLFVGCGSGGDNLSQSPSDQVPAISMQPASQSTPMGLTATFSVVANGSNTLTYQWFKDGAPISGATSNKYTTPATQFADTGETYTVEVSDSIGSTTSNAALLTVTARAPQAGDLLFQQVDADSTVSGYSPAPAFSTYLGIAPPGGGGIAYTFENATGTPLDVNNNCGAWDFAPWDSAGSTGLQTGYTTDYVSNLQNDLSGNMSSPAGFLNSANTVITSVSFLSCTGWFGISWIQTAQAGGFDMAQHLIAPGDFQSAATQEGENGRVITAVSYDAGQIFYLSYGWQGNGPTTYETQVATATLQTAASTASNLAAQGYILTAIGGEGNADGSGILLVGTRVQGDTLSRPVRVVSVLDEADQDNQNQLFQQGYAIVGVAQATDANYKLVLNNWIGER